MMLSRSPLLAVLVVAAASISGGCLAPPEVAHGEHEEGHANAGSDAAHKPERKVHDGNPPAPPDRSKMRGSSAIGGGVDPGETKITFDPPYDGKPVKTQTTEDGIVIEDFVEGDGDAAVDGSRVLVHYTGYLQDGLVFDSSVQKGLPFRVTLGEGRVVKGWEKGLLGVKKGQKRTLTIPAELGYGERKRGKIPANSVLIFTIEVLEVAAPFAAPQAAEAFNAAPVKTTDIEGMTVTDYKLGEGKGAAKDDVVYVHYTGTLKDGTEFDSSIPRGKPIAFPLGQGRVIAGWDKGIEGLKVGGLRKLQIPAVLGYGDHATGAIPANSDLVFTVELMGIDPPTTPATPENRQPAKVEASSTITDPGANGQAKGPAKAGASENDLKNP